MKEWRMAEAARLGISESGVINRLSRGFYPTLRVRRVNARVIFVTDTP